MDPVYFFGIGLFIISIAVFSVAIIFRMWSEKENRKIEK
jgi:hypothetical protein